jgi:hypothetical protein
VSIGQYTATMILSFNNIILEFQKESDTVAGQLIELNDKKENLIDNLVKEFMNYDINGTLLSKIELKLKIEFQQVLSDPAISTDGYCCKFKISGLQSTIEKFYNEITFLKKGDLQYVFTKTWGIPLGVSTMREDPYYLFLILVSLYAMRKQRSLYKPEENPIAKLCQLLILIKIWNGQLRIFIPFCQPDVMRYVTSNMMRKSYSANKYDNPLQLLRMAYIEPQGSSIPKRYFQRMYDDSSKSIEMIDAAWKRVRQLFASGKERNILKHTQRYGSGIAPKYHEAAASNLRISNAKSFDSETGDISDNYSNSSYDEFVDVISNSITMTSKPTYPENFKEFVKSECGFEASRITLLMTGIHELKYQDGINEILQNVFARMSGMIKEDVCGNDFYKKIKKNVISSKHNKNVDEVKKIADKMCESIYRDKLKVTDYNRWTANYKTNSINVIIYAIAYNIKKHICSK